MAQNSVFIGIIESEVKDQFSEWKCNKIGGFPILSPFCKRDIISDIKSLVCDSCHHWLAFILQIYCPIDDSLTDRVLYLFSCINSDCHQKQWIALRFVTPFDNIQCETQSESDSNKKSWIQTDWDCDEDDEDDEDNKDNHQTEESTCNESIDGRKRSHNTHKCEPISDDSLLTFKPFYVSVIDEPSVSISDDKHIKQLIQSYESNQMNTNCGKSSRNTIETYEQNAMTAIYGNDRKTYKFFKRLSQCPQQVIRYEWEGMPLLNSENCEPIVSKCDSCGSDRCFELQLMPALISHLKPVSDRVTPDLDFGTVLIYSCRQNCNQKLGSFSVEQCLVLSDPDSHVLINNQFINKI